MTDNDLMEALDAKLQLVRDRVQGVAEGYANGLYVWGEGGTSKSFTIEDALKKSKKHYKLTNSRLTGKGLFTLLRDYPDVVHVLEDVETLFADKNSFGVIRSALWGQANEDGRQERVVVWHTGNLRDEFVFTGGVVLVSNCRLDDIPQLRAVKSRISAVRYQPSNEEIAALMRKIAGEGHRHGPHHLPPEDCLEVADAIIARCHRIQRNLDLRLFVNGCQDRLQWANGASETHWIDLLESRMKERVVTRSEKGPSRAQRKEGELALARSLAHLAPQERLLKWRQETGKSQAALYRRLDELRTSNSQILTFRGAAT